MPQFYFRRLSWDGSTPGICNYQPRLPSRGSEYVSPATKISRPSVRGTTWHYFRSTPGDFPSARVKLKPRNVYHLQTTLQTTVEYVLIVKVNCWCCYANTHVKTWENIHTDVFIINVSCVYIMNNYNICSVKSKGF